MSDKKPKVIVIGHVGNLPRTSLTASLLRKLEEYVLVDVEGGEVGVLNPDKGTVTLSPEIRARELRIDYPYAPTAFAKEKKQAPWGKKAKRQKRYK